MAVVVRDSVRQRDSGMDLARALGQLPRTADGTVRTRHAPQRRPWSAWRGLAGRLAWPTIIALVLVGPTLGYVAHEISAQRTQERQQADVRAGLLTCAHALVDQLLSFGEALEATRGLFDASDEVLRGEFATFTSQMLLRHPALRLIAWAPAVPRSGRAAFEARVRAESLRDFHVHAAEDAPATLPSAADHYPVLYAEPDVRSAALLGLDLAGDTLRARLLQRALASESTVLSDPLRLGSDGRCGALLALLVKSPQAADAESRPLGVLLIGFEYDDLLARVEARLVDEPDVNLRLSLLAADAQGRTTCLRPQAAAGPREDRDATQDLADEQELHLYGQTLRLCGVPAARFLELHAQHGPLLWSLGVFSGWEIMLGLVLALAASWHGRVVRHQATLVGNVLHNLGDAVIVADRRGSVRLANAAAERLAGVPIGEDGAARWPQHLPLMRATEGRPCAPEQLPMTRAIGGTSVPEELYQLRAAYASAPRDLAVSAQPILDEEGGLHGGVVVMRDVTEQLALQKKAAAMALAGEVQARLFPSAPPRGLALDLAGRVLPAEETSGDYYDWMLEPDGRLVLAIGDVSDHGLSSALMMMSTRAYLRSQVDLGRAPDELLVRVNARLARELPPERFVTLLCVEVEPDTRRVRYANAGHPAAFMLGPEGRLEATLDATGPLLGVMDAAHYRLEEAPALLPGRVLVLLTDGAVECSDRRGRRFEEERLIEVVRRNRQRPAAEIVAALEAALVEFAGGSAPSDDITLVVLKG